jgi:hypothetical protein
MATASNPTPATTAHQPIAITVQMPPPVPTEPYVHWTAAVAPFVALVAAAIAGYIGFRSWRTSRDKLKFDMFAMRFKVYEELMALMAGWVVNWEMQKSLEEFNSIRQKAVFLFGDRVNNYLNNDLKAKLLEYADNYSKLHGTEPDKDGKLLMGIDLTLKLWLNGSRNRLKEVFIDDLKLGH